MSEKISQRLRALGLAVLFVASPLSADEGQWTPSQIAELDREQLKGLGLELAPSELWNDKGGLMRAAVNLSGCSAAFVSERGLITTNHHCAYRAIQAQSKPERDYLKDGFVAKKPADEARALGYTVLVLKSVRDVTREVKDAAKNAPDDRARHAALEQAQKKLVRDCEKKDTALRCRVASFYLGSRFELFEAIELRDIRLVYAPPAGVGEYGGEVDNWMWPRHTGDFALMRAYVAPNGKSAEYSAENVPYRPDAHLTISPEGVRPGEFVAVMGYPGITRRYLPATEVVRQVEQVLPAIVDLYGEWLTVLEAAKKRDPAVAIQVAALHKSLANRHKNSRGMLDGIARMRLIDRRKREDQELATWAKGAERKAHAGALSELAQLTERKRRSFARDFLLEQLGRSNLLGVAIDLTRRARERKKADLERREPYMDRNAPALWKTQERRIRDFDARVDAELLSAIAERARALPADQAAPALANLGAGLEQKLRASKLSDAAFAKKLFDGEPEATERAADPLLALARTIVVEIEAMEAVSDAQSGLEARVGPLYFEMLKSVRKGPVYPDANGTLRLSYATVKGYEPKDGLVAKPQTTLRGALAKHTGQAPFNLPDRVREKVATARDSYWADADLGDVPVCFLSNADTTGGNSGSPVIDGKGRLIGLNFDRVWENIAGDFGYSQERSRNISVDARYLLWMLDRVDNASDLLEELGVAQFRSASVQRSRSGLRRSDPASVDELPSADPATGCGCAAPAGSPQGAVAVLVALVALLARRRALPHA